MSLLENAKELMYSFKNRKIKTKRYYAFPQADQIFDERSFSFFTRCFIPANRGRRETELVYHNFTPPTELVDLGQRQ